MTTLALIQEHWPLITGVGAAVSTAAGTGVNFALRTLRRMEKLETENRQLRLDLDTLRGECKNAAESSVTWQNRTSRLEARLSDARSLREEVKELDRSMDKVVARLPDFVRQDVFVSYVNEQRASMNEIHRDIGTIEGTLKRL